MEGKDIADARKCIDIISKYLSDPDLAARTRRHSLKLAARFAVENAGRFLQNNMFAAAWRQIKGALLCGVPCTVIWRIFLMVVDTIGRMTRRKTEVDNALLN
jgi:hypothetical protein